MFTGLSHPPVDPFWSIAAACRADPRPRKMDLGLGIYRDADGRTPVLDAVRIVEERLARLAPSKVYRSLSGNAAFNIGMAKLLLGSGSPALDRTISFQTVGGTGALRTLAELVASANPDATVWLSDPGYLNHRPLMQAAGLHVAVYPWSGSNGVADPAVIVKELEHARAGDILLVQGCCHNPTGNDLTPEGWSAIAAICARRGIVPLVDMAYQGLGDGIDDDAAGLRLLVATLDTVLVAASCSKTMGLYCERTGAALAVVATAAMGDAVRGVLESIARRTYSMPPEHGAAVAAALLDDPAGWLVELAVMRDRIRSVRYSLTAALQHAGAPRDMLAVRDHRGLFSLLPLNAGQMARLRDDHAIYGAPDGRINIAGIADAGIPRLAQLLTIVAMAHRPCTV